MARLDLTTQTGRDLRKSKIDSAESDLALLIDASSRLWRLQDLREGLEEILQAAIEFLGADKGNIRLLDERGILTIAAQSGFQDQFLRSFGEVSADDPSACGRALRSGQRIVVEDIVSDPGYAPLLQTARAADYRAVQSTPLFGRSGAILGMLSTHFSEPHVPSERELSRLDLYAQQAANFIERCRIEDALRWAASQQRAIANLGEFALRERDLQALFDYATRLIAETLNVELCKVLQCIPGERLLLLAGIGWKDGLLRAATVSADLDSQAGYTLASRAPVIVTDLRDERRFSGPPLLIEHGVVSGMSCIIRDVEGKPWGVLGAHAKRRVTFTIDDINFLMSAANILADAIHRHRTESALQQNEKQLRDLAETIPQLAWYANPDGYITWYNKRWYDYTGTSAEQMRGWGWQTVHDPTVLPEVLQRWKWCVASGQPFSMVFPLRGADGVFRPFLTKVMPLTDDQGCVVQWFGTNTDISEQQEMQEALRASQQRFSEFMHCLPGLAWIKDLEGRYVYANEAAQNVFGKADRLYGKADDQIFEPETAAQFRKNDGLALGQPAGIQVIEQLKHADGSVHYSLVSKFPMTGVDGRTNMIGGVAIDVTDWKLAEKRQHLMLNELNHRVKNTLAIVQAIASQTWRATQDATEFQSAFSVRVMALARAHSLLTKTQWQGASIRDLIVGALEPFTDNAGSRISSEGPDIHIDSNSAVTLSLLLHELATNASKHGSLSVPNGSLSVLWHRTTDDDQASVKIAWREKDGPVATAPVKKGFGSRLVVASMEQLKGNVELEFPPEGFRCTLLIPLTPNGSTSLY
jgi:PAS domain S-box-containing protein